MFTIYDFLQEAGDRFQPVVGLNNAGVMDSFHAALSRIRSHLIAAAEAALPGGSHDDLCYNVHVGTSMLVGLMDGLAVYVEKKIRDPPAGGVVYWDRANTFLDPRFAALHDIKVRTAARSVAGGVTVNALRNFVKHYMPWLWLAGNDSGRWDINFQVDGIITGPILRGAAFSTIQRCM